MPNTASQVAARIRSLCEERSITPNGLSYLSGVSQSTIKSILNGESKSPEVLTIRKLCNGFEISLAEFFIPTAFPPCEEEIE